jgi:ribonuclease HII
MLKSNYYKNLIEAGCDEAGRGCLAGPVFAAAVILPRNFKHPELNDSKKLTEKQRLKIKDDILEMAVAWKVASVSNAEIDEMNILRASIKAMHIAVEGLNPEPQFLIIDGNCFYPYKNIPWKTIIKGDGLYFSIAAASVLAKTFRDEYMINLDREYPGYDWISNKGYPTKKHKEAIKKMGITPYHRRSFNLFENQLEFKF